MQLLRLLIVVLSFSLSVFASDSPFTGTWKLNAAKSKLTAPAPQTDVVFIEADDNGIKYNEDLTDDRGPMKESYEVKFDGKDYPIKDDPDSDSISCRRLDANTLTLTFKKAGKITETVKAMASKDGKSLTSYFTAYSKGKPEKGVAVYDKQ